MSDAAVMEAAAIQKVRALTAQGRAAEAADAARAALRAGEAGVNLAPALAEALSAAGRHDETVAVWRAAACFAPAHDGVFMAIAAALMAGGARLAEAEAALLIAARLSPGDASPQFDLGRLYEALRQWDRADDHFTAAALLRADRSAATWRRIGVARRNANRDAAAMAAFSRVVADGDGGQDERCEALTALGGLSRDVGNLDGAENAFDRTLAINRFYSPAHFHRGIVRMLRGAGLRAAFDGGDDIAAAHVDRARRLTQEGRLKDACGHYHEALMFRPDFAPARDGLFSTLDVRRRACVYGAMPDKAHTDEWGNIALFASMEKYNRTLVNHPALAGVPAGAVEGAARGKPRVFDGFTFYNELDLLELRLEELGDVVDAFVLVEATHTFQGAVKPLIFTENKQRFARWADKIVHIVADLSAAGPSPWDREGAQRDAILQGLEGRAAPDDVVFIGDVDEFPRRRTVEAIRDNPAWAGRLNRLSCDYYCGFLDFRCNYMWHKPISLPMRLLSAMGPDHARFMAIAKYGGLIYDAGWHFSWLGGIEKVLAKLKSYAHSEYTGLADEGRDKIMAALKSGKGIFALMDGTHGYAGEFRTVPVDESFPDPVRADPERYVRLGWMF
jgi:tetratricopeptide (TPR) repeat protein